MLLILSVYGKSTFQHEHCWLMSYLLGQIIFGVWLDLLKCSHSKKINCGINILCYSCRFTDLLLVYMDRLWLYWLNTHWGLKGLVISYDAADYLTTSTWLITSGGGVKSLTMWRVSDLGVYVLQSQPTGGLQSPLCVKRPLWLWHAAGWCKTEVIFPPSENVSQCTGCSAFHYMPFHVNGAFCWSCKLPIPSQRISQAVSSHPLHYLPGYVSGFLLAPVRLVSCQMQDYAAVAS